MELILIVTAILLSISLSSSAAAPTLTSHVQQGIISTEPKLSLSTVQLPRKLRLFETKATTVSLDQAIQGHGVEASTSSHNSQHKEDLSGYQKEESRVVVDGSSKAKKKKKKTWKEWAEDDDDTSQFFTMDYSHVRRRRPIHNKALPVGP